jgi:hypothetical protein
LWKEDKSQMWDKVKLDDEDVPDWLKWSLDDSKKEEAKTEKPKKEKKTTKKKVEKKEIKKEEVKKEEKSENKDSNKKDELWDDWMTVPDWLKTD